MIAAEKTVWGPHDRISVPLQQLPSFRGGYAEERGVDKNLLFVTWGGIGDQVCAEPTLRYALETFKDCEISLASERPEFFQHLNFKDVFNTKKVMPLWENYLRLDTIVEATTQQSLVPQFISHLCTHCVDFPALCALTTQLPIADREIKLVPSEADFETVRGHLGSLLRQVVIHPGKHWQSKTFPCEFWNAVINELVNYRVKPILIGGSADDNRTTVDVDASNCLDLRDKLSLMESVALLQTSKVLLTNDSAPLHMAASGDNWIGFVATCKHADFITHWRNGEFGWRMKNFSKGNVWDYMFFSPNQRKTLEVEFVPEAMLESWLPNPREYATWAVTKL